MRKVVVALTSYPKRIKTVHKVIESLLNQTICADDIILYLSIIEFPQKEKDLPAELAGMIGKGGFRIEWTMDNLKSHKKYFYVLQKERKSIVITVDDDVIYSETLISDLIHSYEKFPFAISARRGRIILKNENSLKEYDKWDMHLEEYADTPRMDICAIGVGGVLYPPFCATKEWFEKEDIKNLAENQDDLWLKYNEIRDKIPVVYVKCSQQDIFLEDTKQNGLCTQNMYGGANDVCIQKLREYIVRNNMNIYKEWFMDLMQQEEYILQKKQYFAEKMREVFSHFKGMHIYLYGAGKRAKIILNILEDAGVSGVVKAISVSNKQNNPSVLDGIEVKQIDEIDQSSEFGVICGVSDAYRNEVTELLKQYNCRIIDISFQGILPYYTI